jgi:hypothetical protein
MLRHEAEANGAKVPYRNSSPFVATLLSFVPGLGAAYNGQTAKAIVHFAIFTIFFQMAVLTQGVPFFVLGVLGIWLFAAVDACRTAQLIRAGLNTETEEDLIARRLYGNPFAWGITLVVIGTLFLLHTLLRIQLPVRQLLPVGLVALGAYMLFDYVRRHRTSSRIIRFDSRRPPPSVVVSSAIESPRFRSGETTQFGRKEIENIPFKRSS